MSAWLLGKGAIRRPATDAVVADRFARDAALWKCETACMSSVTDMVLNPAYQRIIGLGPAAIPLLIEELRTGLNRPGGPDHWFWALHAIVGDDKADGATTVKEAAQRWVDWYDMERL